VKHARNEAMKEHDHRPLRDALIAVVKETSMKILLCPEDRTQMAVGKELLLDPLPEEVRSKVVWRPDYWLTAEAVSTYVRSAGLFGNEMHSPIMCIRNGIPAIVCRWPEQTTKGFMWEDIGLGDWLFDLDDEARVAQVRFQTFSPSPAIRKRLVPKRKPPGTGAAAATGNHGNPGCGIGQGVKIFHDEPDVHSPRHVVVRVCSFRAGTGQRRSGTGTCGRDGQDDRGRL